ncbi:MAG: trp RNA-binding attenuation protein MtrB [Clostridiales bacterium]|jgi:ABC-type oligopeptide transport system ATPase subunit|nr:trp RNA-binding attenuation protein MtrB [Clostridiales bacterium]
MSEALLDVRRLRVYFPIRSGLLRKTVGHVYAVENVSFQVGAQDVFALVGESGCGKTTTGAAILRLIEPTDGEVVFDGVNIIGLTRGKDTRFHHTEKLDSGEVYIAQFTDNTSAIKIRGKASVYTGHGVIRAGE